MCGNFTNIAFRFEEAGINSTKWRYVYLTGTHAVRDINRKLQKLLRMYFNRNLEKDK
jgi:hypothetical protein